MANGTMRSRRRRFCERWICGANFLDTVDAHGIGDNEELIGRTIRGRRDEVFLATRFANIRTKDDPKKWEIGGRPEYVRQACAASLKRLGVDTIDIYYQHRVDPETPIEDTVGAMTELVKAGKVRYLGLSEASPATIRRGAPGPPDYGARDRVLALGAARGGPDSAYRSRIRDRFCALRPVGTRISDGCDCQTG